MSLRGTGTGIKHVFDGVSTIPRAPATVLVRVFDVHVFDIDRGA